MSQSVRRRKSSGSINESRENLHNPANIDLSKPVELSNLRIAGGYKYYNPWARQTKPPASFHGAEDSQSTCTDVSGETDTYVESTQLQHTRSQTNEGDDENGVYSASIKHSNDSSYLKNKSDIAQENQDTSVEHKQSDVMQSDQSKPSKQSSSEFITEGRCSSNKTTDKEDKDLLPSTNGMEGPDTRIYRLSRQRINTATPKYRYRISYRVDETPRAKTAVNPRRRFQGFEARSVENLGLRGVACLPNPPRFSEHIHRSASSLCKEQWTSLPFQTRESLTDFRTNLHSPRSSTPSFKKHPPTQIPGLSRSISSGWGQGIRIRCLLQGRDSGERPLRKSTSTSGRVSGLGAAFGGVVRVPVGSEAVEPLVAMPCRRYDRAGPQAGLLRPKTGRRRLAV